MADVDASIVIGSMPDEASAKKTGEALGRAAGAAANSAFLASFNAIFDKIPVSNKPVKGSVSMPVKAREHLNQLIGVAGGAPLGSAESNAAIKHLIGALREYSRKGKLGVDTELAVTAAISGGQDAMRLGNRIRRQGENAAFSQDRKQQTNMDAYARAIMLFGASAGDLQDAIKTGDKDLIKIARAKHVQHANMIMSDRFADVVTPKDLKAAKDALVENSRATKQAAMNSMILSGAISGIAAITGAVSTIMPSLWGQHVTRNVFASKTAYNERIKTAGQTGGGILGTVLGGVAGALIGGPAGAIVGSSVGGTTLGALGGLFGESKKAKWEAHQRTIGDMQTRLRASHMYRGAYSTSFGSMIQEMGMASAGDMENMVGNSQTLAARMMFGQVGENEMLMYSLMPNYFAAAMAGASDAELAAAYAQDLNALPPMFRLWAGSSVGGGSAGMAAFAQDSMFGEVLKGARFAHGVDNAMVGYSGGWQGASVKRGRMNAGMLLSAAMKDTATVGEEAGIYDTGYIRPVFLGDVGKGMVAANSYDLQKAYMGSNGRLIMHTGGGTASPIRTFQNAFDFTGSMFGNTENLLNSRENRAVNDALMGIEEWLQHESIIIQVVVDGNKQEEVRVRGEQAARAGQMSVYFGG